MLGELIAKDVGRVVESGDPGEIGAGLGGVFGHVTGMGHDEMADTGRELGNDPYVVEQLEAAGETAESWAASVCTGESASDYAVEAVGYGAEAAWDEVTSWF